MEKIRTHYLNLQVTEEASIEVIKGAYKHLTQKYHPDKNLDDRERCEKITRIINEAYRVLSDPVLRKEHDEWIKEQNAALFDVRRGYDNASNTARDKYDNAPSSDYKNTSWREVNKCFLCGMEIPKGVNTCYTCEAIQLNRSDSLSESSANSDGFAKKPKSIGLLIRLFIAIIGGSAFISYLYYSSNMAKQDGRQTEGDSSNPPSYNSEQFLPENGEIYVYTENPRVAPIEIKTIHGDNYLVKIVSVPSQTTVMTVFIHGGTSVSFDVPLGPHEIKYASGKQWYGYDKLFGKKNQFQQREECFVICR